MIRSNILSANFSDEYKCKSIMKTYDYGKDNLAVIHDVIEDYDNLEEEEQHKQILLHFEHIKRFLHLTDKQLLDKVLGDKINVREYEYIRKIPTYKDRTIELMIKHDIVGMTGKKDWTIDDITEIFRTRKDDIMDRLYLYTNEDKTVDKKKSRSVKIFKSLYEDAEYDKNGKLKRSEALVNFINEYLESDKEYDCKVFFNDKPIVIYKSEIQKIKEISKKYRTNEKDGRRIVRLACLLLAWQKAKEAADTANTLGDEIATLANKYIQLSDAVKTDASAKEDLMTTQTELLKKLGLEGESIDDLIAKYGSLSNAIKQASIIAL